MLRGPFERAIVYNCLVLFLETVGKDLTNHVIKFAPFSSFFFDSYPSCALIKQDLNTCLLSCVLCEQPYHIMYWDINIFVSVKVCDLSYVSVMIKNLDQNLLLIQTPPVLVLQKGQNRFAAADERKALENHTKRSLCRTYRMASILTCVQSQIFKEVTLIRMHSGRIVGEKQ